MSSEVLRKCRICLGITTLEAVALVKGSEWLNKIKYCFGITIQNNTIPHKLCHKCMDCIQLFFDFKEKCLKSEIYWKSCENISQGYEDKSGHWEEISSEIHFKTEKNEKDDENQNSLEHISNHDFALSSQNDENSYVFEKDNMIFFNSKDECDEDKDVPTEYVKDIKIDRRKSKTRNKTVKNVEKHNRHSFNCSLCNKKFSGKGWRDCHMRKKHNGVIENKVPKLPKNDVEYCGLCEYTSGGDQVDNHLKEKHALKSDLKCSLCEFKGHDFADMVEHRYNHYPNGIKFVRKCYVCNKAAYTKLSLQFHYRKTHLNKKGGYCTHCGKTFDCLKNFKDHVGLHERGGKYICDLCGRQYMTKYRIIAHLADHSDKRQHICHICGTSFKRRNAVTNHIQSLHKENTPIKCEKCNKMIKSEFHMKVHMKRMHGEKHYECKLCLKQFTCKTLLESHIFWHGNERPFACITCGNAYKAKGQLKVHMRKHTGERPYECEYCGVKFASLNQKKRHLSVHTGFRPHKCLHCTSSFNERRHLVKHCSISHKDKGVFSVKL